MIETKFTMSTGEDIFVYDEIFSPAEMTRMRTVVEHSVFTLGALSQNTVNGHGGSTFFQSSYDQQDIDSLGIYKSNNFLKIITDHIEPLHPRSQWVNVTTHLTNYTFHVDSDNTGNKSLLYYVNTQWSEDWGGETIFKNSKNQVEIAVECKPGRVVVFNSDLSHRPSALSLKSHPYRFIFVQQFTKN